MVSERDRQNRAMDAVLRPHAVCIGCGEEKHEGTLVCWGCFKGDDHPNPLKYCKGGIMEWLSKEYARHT